MRSGERVGIKVQPRDIAVLRGLFESRVMTRTHISALYFDGKAEMGKKRLQKLMASNLVRERPRRSVADKGVLFISRAGFRVLRDNGHLADYPQISELDLERRVAVAESKLHHELEVMDVKVRLTSAISDPPHFRIEEFLTWPRLYEFKSSNPRGQIETTQPDGLLRMTERTSPERTLQHIFFLEVDRSTSAPGVLADRVHCYGDYYRSGDFAIRSGGTKDTRKNYGFRVLIVCKTEERRNTVAAKLTLNTPPVQTLAWITTLKEMKENPRGAIWIRPGDYRKVTAGSSFDPFTSDSRFAYRTNSERVEFVRRAIEKHSLFADTSDI